jgi:hypothetical protein
MRLLLRNGLEEVEILSRGHLPPGPGEGRRLLLDEPRTEDEVMALLGRLVADPAKGAALRRALADELGGLIRYDNRSFLRDVAQQVLAGRLRIIRRRRFQDLPVFQPTAGSSTPREDEAAARQSNPAATSTASPAPAPAAAAAEDLLLAGVDAQAQAATLATAADSGAALCEA